MRFVSATLCGVLLPALLSSGALAQTPPTATPELIKFDVASVKPNKGLSQGMGGRGFGEGRWDRTNAPLDWLIIEAFGIRGEQLTGVPAWAKSERFDVDARTDATNATWPQALAMMQALLKERFGLISHRETRDVPTYDVVLARATGELGADLHQTEHICTVMTPDQRAEAMRTVAPSAVFCGWYIRPNDGRSAGDGQRLDMLLTQLPFILGRPVINRTGLTAPMTWMLKWRIEGVESEAPELPVALQEQLGLKLVPSHGPQEFLVVDRVSPLTPN